jgi:hypothetical protein
VAEVGGAGVGVSHAEALEEHLADVSPVVAVGVLEEEHLGAVGADQAAIGANRGGGDGELVGEEGELVGAAVAVGVLADANAIVAEVSGLEVVWIVHGFHDVGAAAVVPGDVDRVDDVRLAGEEREFEPDGDVGQLHRVRGRKRFLAAGDRLALLVAGKCHLLLFQFRKFQ